MERCKTSVNKPEKCFVQRVNGAPEPMMVVGTEKSFRPSAIRNVYLRVMYGYAVDGVYHEGLVDADDSAAFDGLLASLEQEWNSREESQSPRFFPWFSENIATYMQVNMLTPERSRNGVTGKFTTNGSESINAMIKRKVEYKSQDLITFVTFEEIFHKQEEMVRSAFIGEGDYELVPEAREFHLGEKYFQIPNRQKLLHERKYYSWKLPSDTSCPPSISPPNVSVSPERWDVDAEAASSCDLDDSAKHLDELVSIVGMTTEHCKSIVQKTELR
jgi:hypothetical protein